MKTSYLASIFILIIFIGYLIHTPFIDHQNLESKLQGLSKQENEYLTNFFQHLVRVSGFGYILFGDKPMGIDFIDKEKPSKNIEGIDYMDDNHIMFKLRFKEGFDIWKKYRSLFPSTTFIFFEYPHHSNPHFTVICLINKQKFLETIKTHLSDFESILGKIISPEEILEDYITFGASFQLINQHDGLLGTLLGYGRNNAWTFHEEKNLENTKLVGFVSTICKENNEDASMLLPGFAALENTDETNNLAKKYQKQRQQIQKIYNHDGYLIPCLKKLVH